MVTNIRGDADKRGSDKWHMLKLRNIWGSQEEPPYKVAGNWMEEVLHSVVMCWKYDIKVVNSIRRNIRY